MEVSSVWNDQIPEKGGVVQPVGSVAFSPDGSLLVSAAGSRVLLYRAGNGDLLHSLKGHKDTVNSVSFSSDGSRFASGGSDNVVVIWKATGQGLLKYSHASSIQCLSFSPSACILLSCSESDFGLWTPEQKQVTKEKVSIRIVSCAWSSDGQFFALGHVNGLISIRNRLCEEVTRIERNEPIWCLRFIPETLAGTRAAKQAIAAEQASSTPPIHTDSLAVGCWDKTYSVYKLTPGLASNIIEKPLNFYPLTLLNVYNPLIKMSYMIISGSNRQIQIYSREGIRLSTMNTNSRKLLNTSSSTANPTASSNKNGSVEITDSWIWGLDCHTENEVLAYGTQNGKIEYLKLNFESVHALYKDRYAYRENLTEVMVQHLVTDKKVCIKVKDMVHRVSLYRNKLAVQLLNRICIYESAEDDPEDIHFRLNRNRIHLSNINSRHIASSLQETKTVSNLLQVTYTHLFVTLNNVVELYTHTGLRERLWTLNSDVIAMTIDGGIKGDEGVLLSLQDGSIVKLYAKNPFPIEVTKRSNPVYHLSMNVYRTLLSTVDSENQLTVIDTMTQDVIFSLPNVKNAVFNIEVADLLAVTNMSGSVSIIASLYPLHHASNQSITTGGSATTGGTRFVTPDIQDQHLQGMIVGFRGQKVYSVHRGIMSANEVPQSLNVLSAIENGNFLGAYRVACLGATEADWRLLGMRSLRANHIDVAKKAFARIKDVRYLGLIESIETSRISSATGSNTAADMYGVTDSAASGLVRQRGGLGSKLSTVTNAAPTKTSLEPQFLARMLAYEGHYVEAAKVLMRAGLSREAIEMFTMLVRWEDAKTFARNANFPQSEISALTTAQAKWLLEIRDWKGAAELFMTLSEFSQAAHIIGENQDVRGWQNTMMDVVRNCPPEDRETLIYCGEKLSSLEDISFARQAYTKAKDYDGLMALLVKRQFWTEAAQLAEEYAGLFDMAVFLSYAEWLVSQDRYEEAMEAFKKCGRLDLSRRVLSELTENAVLEKRFKDAGYYYWLLAKELEQEVTKLLDSATISSTSEESKSGETPAPKLDSVTQKTVSQLSQQAAECEHKADLYYAYSSIHSYVTDPFTSFEPDMLFQVARLIINSLGVSDSVPAGISKTATLYTLAKQAVYLGTYKLARTTYDRLIKLQIPSHRIDDVELDVLMIQAKPMTDDEDHIPVCYRCDRTNPLLNPFTNSFAKGDVCTNCGHPFVRSFLNFDILPLVEFVPQAHITDGEAMDMIRQPPQRGQSVGGKWQEEQGRSGERLSLHDDHGDDHEANDLFSQCLADTLKRQKGSYSPVEVDPSTLLAMKRSEIFVCKPTGKHKRATFYKNMLPDIQIAISQPCHRFFHLEDFEFAYLSEKKCPYSRQVNVGEYGSV